MTGEANNTVVYHPSLPFSTGGGEEQASCAFSCPVSAGVLDLETGAAAGLGAFNDFFVETRDAGLCPAAGEILVSGVRPGEGVTGLVQYYKGGERRIVEKTFEACDYFCREGLIIGHNLLGFDLPFLAARAAILGVPVPAWVTRGDRVFDTYKMFNTGYGKFATGMLSLQETAALWGRVPDGDSGANFGDLWRGGTDGQRDSLRHYNMLNLVDSLCLAVHSGALGWPEGFVVEPTKVFGWSNCGEYSDSPQDISPCDISQPFFHWITAPKPGLLENGPRAIGGWGRTSSTEARLDFPRGAGRLDAGATMVVGYISSDAGLLHPEDESAAIESGIAEIARLNEEGIAPFTDSPGVSKNYICLRLSAHGGILPSWFSGDDIFLDDRVRGMGEDFLRAVAIAAGTDSARIPIYTGGDATDFMETVRRIGAHRANTAAMFSRRTAA